MQTTVQKPFVNEISDDELLQLSVANNNLRFEIVEGELMTMSPLGAYTGELELSYGFEVKSWCITNNAKAYSSSTGFKLPNNNIRSPDVAIILSSNPNYSKKIEKFFPGAPDFLIEIRSKNDSLVKLKEKMLDWIEGGCQHAFLIDPVERKSYVYRKDKSITEYPYSAILSGDQVLPGFEVCPEKIDPKNE